MTNDEFVPYLGDQDRLYWTLIKRVASSFEENFLLSPLGLKLTLSLLKETATGLTQDELSAIFREDLNRMESREHLRSIAELLRKKPPENIAYLGNWIFISSENEIRARFEAIAKTFYNADITTVNTQSATVTANEINQVVLNATLGNILYPVNEGDVDDMRMLVLNTLYFEGDWRYQFAASATKASHFYVSPTTLKIVPFMKVIQRFYYAESTKLDAKILRMPYLGNKFAMYFIVPNSLTGLSYVEENIMLLPGEIQFLEKHIVDVTLPKFKFVYTLYLERTLKKMGLRIAFEESASYPGIARGQLISKRLKLSKVMQRTLIAVNELGVGVSSSKGNTTVSEVNIDINEAKEVMGNRPFFFFIQDEASRQLLVFGRFTDPTL
ncbi:unnamed protein product [Arctia plantaginis]|uniref:Serpin domain-containing protein n=1 Tax=Arctia plantaginis TaxID=874455 RepID=A0A8S0ZLJ8_ARCPL|nr:unnamed protein product [Arctia plantaginis]CAB3238337.1 unnamed protein product [Arctia plantaginis]